MARRNADEQGEVGADTAWDVSWEGANRELKYYGVASALDVYCGDGWKCDPKRQ